MLQHGGGNSPVAVFLAAIRSIHAQDMGKVFIVGRVIREIAVKHQQSKETNKQHQCNFAESNELACCECVQVVDLRYRSRYGLGK
ncbi:hypothetical protein D3C75_1179090 [compost metagenome]